MINIDNSETIEDQENIDLSEIQVEPHPKIIEEKKDNDDSDVIGFELL